MRSSSIGSRIASLAVLVLGGCTMVLGIHKAEQDTGSTISTGTGSTGTGSGSGSGGCKTVAQECLSCLKSRCAADTADCLKDTDCRRSLDSYNGCLDSNCKDNASCLENRISNQGVSLCIHDTCNVECSDGTALSRCDLYCACMESSCASNFGTELGGSIENCMAKCKQWTLDRDVKCRWTHCEFAAHSAADAITHCPHAAGNPDVCIVPMSTPVHVCATGGETGFPCSVGRDCCSGMCLSGVCG
jgi:hypothetical protein